MSLLQISWESKTNWFYMDIVSANIVKSHESSDLKRKSHKAVSHLVAACWGGRSASQMAERSSSGWLWHFVQSTYWLSPECLSSSLSSRRCLQRETQQMGGTGIHAPWGSQWPHFHHRVPRKWHQSCLEETNTKGHVKVKTAFQMLCKGTAERDRTKYNPPDH